jgi:hypothetical protein
MRLAAPAGVLCGLAFFGPSTAQGEVLTGHARSAVSSFSRSSPTRPILRNASIRYDSEQGSILVVARLHEALAPPSTRALGAWNVNVDLGEFIDPPFCLGRGSTDLTHLAAGPSDAIQASVRGAGAGSIEIGGHPVRSARVIKAMSADRTQIIVVAQSPALAHRRWICWDAGIDKRDETEFSDTDPAFFDGHDNTDSPFGPYATTELATQISDLNRLLSGKIRLAVPGHTSCAQRHGTLATCRA